MAASHIIAELSQRIRMIERTGHVVANNALDAERRATIVANSLPGLERLLCAAGWPRGGLVEWLAEGRGSGSLSLALWASRAAWQDSLLVMIDSRRELHAPAAVPFAVDLSKTVFIRPERPPDALWSLEQSLRTRGVGAVLCDVEQLSPQACRRLQLAAEMGGGLGILLRPAKARGQPSFAEYRFLVQPLPIPVAERLGYVAESLRDSAVWRRWRVELLRGRKRFGGDSVIVELSNGPDGLCMAAQLASATPAA